MTENKKPEPVIANGLKYCEGGCRYWDHRTSWCERLERRVTHGELCEPAILARLEELGDDNAVLKHNNEELQRRMDDRRNIFFHLVYASEARKLQSKIKRLEKALADECAYHEWYTAAAWRVETRPSDPLWHASLRDGPEAEGVGKGEALRALYAKVRDDG